MVNCEAFLISETRLRDPIFDLDSKRAAILFRARVRRLGRHRLQVSSCRDFSIREHNYLFHSRELFHYPMEVGAQTPAPLSDQVTPVFAILGFTLVVAIAVNADPITVAGSAAITNGQFFGPQGTVSLSGQNFSANATDFGSVSTFGNFGISPCSRSLGGLNGRCSGASLNFVSTGSDPKGTFTINGTTFTSSVIDSLSLNFQSVNFVIPQDLLDAAAVRIIAPFTFIGVGSAFERAASKSGRPGNGDALLNATNDLWITACF